MENKSKEVKNYTSRDLARPYINNQVYTKMYKLDTALKYGTIFPELNLLDSEMYNKDLYSTPKKRSGGKR